MLHLDAATSGYIADVIFMLISLVATFLSANPKIKKIWVVAFLNTVSSLIIVVYLITVIPGQRNYRVFAVFSAILLLFDFLVSFYVWKTQIYSRKRIMKTIIQFTDRIKSCGEMRLFCGDLSFLGDVSDGSIEKNRQYCQIKRLIGDRTCSLFVICCQIKDIKLMQRLGFLIEELERVNVRFYGERCQDINLRGRIIRSSDGTDSVILIEKTDKRNGYKPIVYDRASSSGNLYINLWDTWWEQAKEDASFLEECRREYHILKTNKNLEEKSEKISSS